MVTRRPQVVTAIAERVEVLTIAEPTLLGALDARRVFAQPGFDARGKLGMSGRDPMHLARERGFTADLLANRPGLDARA